MKTVSQQFFAVFLCLFANIALAQADNPFIGTWDLDHAASDFGGITPPETMSRSYASLGDGSFMYLVTNLNPDGSLGGSSATYRYDGDQYPIASLAAGTTAYISYRRFNEKTVEYRVNVNGTQTQIGAKSISNDGRVLTIAIQFPASGQDNQILRFNRRT